METGYILVRTDAGISVPSWAPGPPTKHWLGFLKYDHKTVRQVLTDRCTACGFLKSYAIDRPF